MGAVTFGVLAAGKVGLTLSQSTVDALTFGTADIT